MKVNRIAVCAATLAALLFSGLNSARAVEAEWSFDSLALAPVYNDHTTNMGYRNDATTSGAVGFGTASGFGLPAMPGGDATAMQFPAFTSAQGLSLYDLGPANGGGAFINQYTMAWDILVTSNDAWQSLFQTSASNGNDGDMFIRPASSGGGIGISGNYHGTINSNSWHRIVAVVDSTGTGTMTKYIDGALVGTTGLATGVDGRWALYTDTHVNAAPNADAFVLADNDGDTTPGYISMFYYTDRLTDANTIASWGGADADGIKNVPEPATVVLALAAAIGLAVTRRVRRGR